MNSSTSNATTKKAKRRRASGAPSTFLGYDDEVDTGHIFNAEQKELLNLIEKEDVNEVREFFARGPAFDVSRGEIGRVALRSAIFNERADIAEILLQNGVRVGDALITAVIEGSRECVELFLDSRFFGAGDIGPTDQREGFFMSPLMLAVRLGDHDIIQYMVWKGFKIEQPNNSAQEDHDGKNQEEMQFLLHINSYRTLANPLYMAYSYLYNSESEHPIFRAFSLHEVLDHHAIIDHEFKKDYKQLAEGCEEFAVNLLEQCTTMDEIKILMDFCPDIDDHHGKEADTEEAIELTFLNMALNNRCDKLVAHPYSQLRLNIVLHMGIPEITCCDLTWRKRSFLSKIIYSVCHMLLLPCLAVVYLLVPNLPLSLAMSKPLVKFLSHTGSFVVFLVLLIISVFQDQFHTRIDAPSIVGEFHLWSNAAVFVQVIQRCAEVSGFLWSAFVAFGLSLRKLYSHYVSTQYQLAKANGTNSGHHFSRVDKSMESLFWSMFGLTDLNTFDIDKPEFQITRETGVTLFGMSQVLIQAEDLHWKVSGTRMWMNWVNKGSVLPPPYNLIPYPKAIVHWFRRIRDKYSGYRQNPATHYEVNMDYNGNIGEIPPKVYEIEMEKVKNSRTSHRREVLKQIVERYLHKRREESRREDSENLKDIKVTQELLWRELARRLEGLPRSPFALTPVGRRTIYQKRDDTRL